MVQGEKLPGKWQSWRMSAKPSRKLTPGELSSSSKKTKIRFGSWNVRTLYPTGQFQEMENYNIELICVSEAGWIDSGKRTLSTGHTILYSGQRDQQHRGRNLHSIHMVRIKKVSYKRIGLFKIILNHDRPMLSWVFLRVGQGCFLLCFDSMIKFVVSVPLNVTECSWRVSWRIIVAKRRRKNYSNILQKQHGSNTVH